MPIGVEDSGGEEFKPNSSRDSVKSLLGKFFHFPFYLNLLSMGIEDLKGTKRKRGGKMKIKEKIVLLESQLARLRQLDEIGAKLPVGWVVAEVKGEDCSSSKYMGDLPRSHSTFVVVPEELGTKVDLRAERDGVFAQKHEDDEGRRFKIFSWESTPEEAINSHLAEPGEWE
jgi:hypothetical protein